MQFISLNDAAAILKDGGLVIYPTETALALGCLINDSAIRQIYAIKKRTYAKPLSLLAADAAQASRVADLENIPEEIFSRFWPGPLTVILPCKPNLPELLVNSSQKIAIRVTSSPLAAELARLGGQPLTATSANISGKSPANSYKDIDPALLKALDASKMAWGIVQSGETGKYAMPSTIVEPICHHGRWQLKIIRAGAIGRSELNDPDWEII